MKAARILLVAIFVLGLSVASASAQGRGGAPAPPKTAKQAAPIDVTGYWVAYITEDWRYRMMTPPKGDYRGVTLSADARKVADAWDFALFIRYLISYYNIPTERRRISFNMTLHVFKKALLTE